MINPLPALGASSRRSIARMGLSVAPEIRPSVLMAGSVEARLSTVEVAMRESLRRLAKMVEEEERS